MAGGTPHQYLQSLINMGTMKVVVEETGAVGDAAEAGADGEQGAVGGEAAEEEDGIQVLKEEEKPDVKQGEADSSGKLNFQCMLCLWS
jgi:hypothetical protein